MIWAQNLLALGNNWAAENQFTTTTKSSTTTTIKITTTTTTTTISSATTTQVRPKFFKVFEIVSQHHSLF